MGHSRAALEWAKARGDFGGMVAGELRVERCAKRLRNALRWHGMEEQGVLPRSTRDWPNGWQR